MISINEIDKLKDMAGLASLICACDHVISTDNTNVFLAGALGVTTHRFVDVFM